MICSIHQPNYIPYLGLFNKIAESDIFVFYDNAQYTKGDYHNRNKIKGANGEILLTIPVNVSLGQKINEVKFNNKILKKHLKTIEINYKKSEYFNDFFPILEELYSYNGNNLAEFNINFIKKISEYIGIKTKFIVLSELKNNLNSNSTDALIDICNLVGAKEYISGAGGKNYVEEDTFKNAGIDLFFQDFKHPTYNQLWGDFIPYMSIIDLIFNEGEKSLDIIKSDRN